MRVTSARIFDAHCTYVVGAYAICERYDRHVVHKGNHKEEEMGERAAKRLILFKDNDHVTSTATVNSSRKRKASNGEEQDEAAT